VEKTGNAIAVFIDANNDVGVGVNRVILVAGAAFGEFGNVQIGFAVFHEIFIDRCFFDWLSGFTCVRFRLIWFGLNWFLALRDDSICSVLSDIDSVVDVAVVVIGVSEMVIANLADNFAEIDDGAIGGDTAFDGLNLIIDVSVESGIHIGIGGFELLNVKVNNILVGAKIVIGFNEIIVGDFEAVTAGK
jgi:hypothetical protein